MIELYAFACGARELPEDCEAVSFGHLIAVVGPARGDTREDAVHHGLVVQALVDASDAVLPARFGERFAGVDALAAAVAPRQCELAERLAAVDGCVELAVRVARNREGDLPRPTDGGAYMRARLRAATADAAAASTLHAILRRRARAAVVADSALSPLLHDACYLVERDHVDEFVHSVAAYAAAHPELSLVCTGPWAPASFAEAA